VVIPAFNEAARIAPTLERVLGFLERRAEPFEVVVVDDGSTDGTGDIARTSAARGVAVVRLERNRGKGAAVRTGLAATRAERVLVTDADLSTPIEEIERLEEALRDADVAIGSRAVSSSRIPVRQPLHRELAGRTFNLLVRLAGVRGFSDTQCGFKLLDGGLARSLGSELTVDRFAWDVELLWLARRRGLRVAEVGVEWRNDPASRVRLFRDSLSMLADILRFRRRHRAAGRRTP
jgi:dolichyl-phosphate beta-glucosyltransferase